MSAGVKRGNVNADEDGSNLSSFVQEIAVLQRFVCEFRTVARINSYGMFCAQLRSSSVHAAQFASPAVVLLDQTWSDRARRVFEPSKM